MREMNIGINFSLKLDIRSDRYIYILKIWRYYLRKGNINEEIGRSYFIG